MDKRKGFTLIEIILFLAVTAALFIGVALGVRNSIFQQQYNDTTQNFFEFMRSVYSEVSNPQSLGKGNSGYAIYGKMIVFGENTDLLGNPITGSEQQIFVYDVIGNAEVSGTGDIKNMLKSLNAGVAIIRKENNVIKEIKLASSEKYEPKWQAEIEEPNGTLIKKTILVVRHPRSGTINTLVYHNTIQVNAIINDAQNSCKLNTSCNAVANLLKDKLDSFSFHEESFCIDPYDKVGGGNMPRQEVRISENARNASGVQLIELDGNSTSDASLKNKCL